MSPTDQIRHLHMLRSLGEKIHQLKARTCEPLSVHLAPDVAVSIMHSDRFKLKGLLCLCNPYACVASARVTHQTRVLPSGNLTPWTTSPYSYISKYTEYISRYTKTSFLIIVYLEIYDYERKL
jgi:hypothetical protein